jgi:threonine aldolase
MRQGGICAAACIYALDDIDRLAEDHANASAGRGLAQIEGVKVEDPEPIWCSSISAAPAWMLPACRKSCNARHCGQRPRRARAGLHYLDVTRGMIDEAVMEIALR